MVVHVRDAVNSTLAGHDGREYTSPPQPHGDALALVELLLGHPAGADDHEHASWTCAIAGGQRTITLNPCLSPTAPGGVGDAQR
ncbi:MAG: hypothetical protein ABSG43_09975 [Solirubrobacteraceae bacterium]